MAAGGLAVQSQARLSEAVGRQAACAGRQGRRGVLAEWVSLSCSLGSHRLCGMVQFCGDVRKKVLLQLSLLLCHPFPVVSVGLLPFSACGPRPASGG